MMRPIILKAALFREHGEDPKEHSRSRLSMLYLLNWLVMHDRLWLRMYKNTPKLYESGVKYIYKDAVEAPAWQDVATCIAMKTGDCKDFVAWRVAELLEEGVECRPVIQWRKVGEAYRFHALVVYPDGTLEDPSRLLGMSGETNFITPPESGEVADDMDTNKTAEAVVRGLILGDKETKARAKDSYAKLAEMAESDSECADTISSIKRACSYIRSGIKRGGEDVRGLVEAALHPHKRGRSILVPENVRGIGIYRDENSDPVDNLLGLNEQEQAEIAMPASVAVSFLPFVGPLLAPLTPLAVKGADDLIRQAQGGDKKAAGKIADVKAKADQGDATAKADLDALKRVKKAKDIAKASVAEENTPRTWWPWDLYRAGIGPTLH